MLTNKLMFGAKGSSSARFLKSFAKEQKLSEFALKEYNLFKEKLILNHGLIQATRMLVQTNHRCRHYAVGHPKVSYDLGGIWTKVNKQSGIPTVLNTLNRFINEEPNIALYIPNTVYSTVLSPDTRNIATIEDKFTGTLDSKNIEEFSEFCRYACPKLLPSKVDVNITIKGGPNGPSAISQIQDLVVTLQSSFGKWTFDQIINKIYGPNSWLEECFNKCSEYAVRSDVDLSILKWPRGRAETMINAKLEFIPAPAGKTRIVYILNWWIQSVLLPLHDSLMKHFRIMKGDATWDQRRSVELIKLWSQRGHKLYSFDLTAATDRWPSIHQQIVAKAIFGDEIGDIWFYLMTRFAPFSKYHGRHIFYEIGQPMGAYTSWAMLNMSHHMTIRFLSRKYGLPCRYTVLGDDIVISGSELAQRYEQYMTEVLGVKINANKTIQHEEGKPSSAEFARNLVRDGRIVGTISPNLLNQILHRGETHMISELTRELRDKLDLVTYVAKDGTLLPKPLDALLSHKMKDIAILNFSIPYDYGQPITILESVGEMPEYEDTHVLYPNPWEGLDAAHVKNMINFQYLEEAKVRLEQLKTLHTNLQSGKTTAVGYALDWEHHPISYMLSNLEKEMVTLGADIAFMKPRPMIVPGLIDTSIDLLIDVLTKGSTYKQWRDGKVMKSRKISSYIRRLHKGCPQEFLPTVPIDWSTLWLDPPHGGWDDPNVVLQPERS
jgi:hypothetical protein